MTNSDIVKQILAAEQQAKQILSDAESKKLSFEIDLDESIQKMRLEMEQDADEKIEDYRMKANEKFDLEVARLDSDLGHSLKQLDETFENKKDAFVKRLLGVILENA